MLPLRNALRQYGDFAAALAIGVMASVFALAVPAWKSVELKGFDTLTSLTAPGEAKQPIVLVSINEESFGHLKARWPFPRSMHADLVRRLARGGAAVIAIDVLLADASTEADDRAFAEAIRKAGNVVLASDFTYAETDSARVWKRTEPFAPFIEAGALSGIAAVPFDADKSVRQVPPEPDAFWRQVMKILQVRAPALAVPAMPAEGSMIRYVGGFGAFPAIPYHLVLEASDEDLKGAFEGRVVVVGRDLRAAPEIGMAQGDVFLTAFTAESGGLQAGYRIHATLVENALNGNTIRPAGALVVAAINLLAAFVTVILMRRFSPFVAALPAIALVAIILAGSWFAFTRLDAWLPVAAPVAVVVLAWLTRLANSYRIELARKREVQRAFSLYVAPTVVQQLLAEPERLSLGGESREITVMFTDLAGFTTLTEKNPPDVVAKVLTEHFTAMSDLILEHGGTVIQFIGDAIMAFWGAPLDEPNHRGRAIEAAIAMQEGMARLRTELVAQGQPPLHMRVGLNTGHAIVGNMGSRRRFAYSALGDCVNLASRLEGTNKLYGTEILISGETAKGAGTIALRPVDRVRVAGKSEAVDVFTPCADPAFVEASRAALAATHARDWNRAQSAWQALLDAHPGDKGIRLHLDRIAIWRHDPPPWDWDGGVSLDKL